MWFMILWFMNMHTFPRERSLLNMARFSFFHRSKDDPAELNAHSIMAAIVFYLIFGALLALWEDKALAISSYVLASLLVLLGGYQVFAFIGAPVMRKMTEPRLAYGIVFLLCGAMLFFNTDILDRIFPFFWGLSLLFGGLMKAQYAFAQYSLKIKRWWIMLIFACFSLLIGVLALTRPGFLGDHMERVIGIMLMVEAVLDLVVFFLMNHAMKKLPAYTRGTLPLEENETPPVPAAPNP